jgi:hypothetical protein
VALHDPARDRQVHRSAAQTRAAELDPRHLAALRARDHHTAPRPAIGTPAPGETRGDADSHTVERAPGRPRRLLVHRDVRDQVT